MVFVVPAQHRRRDEALHVSGRRVLAPRACDNGWGLAATDHRYGVLPAVINSIRREKNCQMRGRDHRARPVTARHLSG